MSREQTIAVWANFMITAIKRKYRLSHAAFLKLAKQYGLFSFLLGNYELLHYYDADYVAEDTAKYILEQGGKI